VAAHDERDDHVPLDEECPGHREECRQPKVNQPDGQRPRHRPGEPFHGTARNEGKSSGDEKHGDEVAEANEQEDPQA
jgi:hypothetical protein